MSYYPGPGIRYRLVWTTAGDLWRIIDRHGRCVRSEIVAEGNDFETMAIFAALLNCGTGTEMALDLLSGPVPVEAEHETWALPRCPAG